MLPAVIQPNPPPARRALVTGASSGIGADCARALAAAGWEVWTTYRTGEAAAAAPHGRGLVLDLDEPDSATRMVADFHARSPSEPGLDALVHAAGYVQPGLLAWLEPADLRRQLEVNTVGAHATTRALLPALRARRGRGVWISSVSGRVSLPGIGAYAASKFALEALADAWRIELAGDGIPLTLIEPGPVATPIWDKADRAMEPFRQQAGPGLLAAMRGRIEDGKREAIPVAEVTRAVLRVLDQKRPPARVMLSREAWAVRLLRSLPDRVRDALVLRQFQSLVKAGNNPST
ncbi:MAG: SDR family NAD(P)-dependent oxidoreductase [Candidatus Methylacidiphilales bacterium]|nr:SDR family NAD(P)-dependent oxidoreductase [Candidatus Methylacidiphilales bacterium]